MENGALEMLIAQARAAARSIRAEHCEILTRQIGLKLVQVFRPEIMPRRRPGRRRNKRIDLAHEDWKQGKRGLSFYQRHIRGYVNLPQWRREKSQKTPA